MPITDFSFPTYEHKEHPDLYNQKPRKVPVVIVGAGPSGMSLALDLASHGIASVIIDRDDTVSFGSRAICYSKRTLEILHRLGVSKPLLKKGIRWNKGSVYFHDTCVYRYRLLEDSGYRMPAFINLQQYYLEQALIDRVFDEPLITLRMQEQVINVTTSPSSSFVQIASPRATYTLQCNYLVAADGANSIVRKILGVEPQGEKFDDYFLICDVKLKEKRNNERIYWFNPDFHPNGSVLLHRQPDEVYRIDFQLGRNIDVKAENDSSRYAPRLNAMLGENQWEMEWSSVYSFRCRRLPKFVYGSVIFLGDSAHQVSPFGARGCNGAIGAVDNIGWKLARVLLKKAPRQLLKTYSSERGHAADINIKNSTRSALFISPENETTQQLRDAALSLSRSNKDIRPYVNSGRLSEHCDYDGCSLVQDAPLSRGGPQAPRGGSYLQDFLGGAFVLLSYRMKSTQSARAYCSAHDDIRFLSITSDPSGLIGSRLGVDGPCYLLIRPDQYRVASFPQFSPKNITRAYRHALGISS